MKASRVLITGVGSGAALRALQGFAAEVQTLGAERGVSSWVSAVRLGDLLVLGPELASKLDVLRAGGLSDVPAGAIHLRLEHAGLRGWRVLGRASPQAEPGLPPGDEDCTRCGACCFNSGRRYVVLTPECLARLGDEERARLTVSLPDATAMRMAAGRCAALEVRAGLLLCSIYERRPAACRKFERGSSDCGSARARELPSARAARSGES